MMAFTCKLGAALWAFLWLHGGTNTAVLAQECDAQGVCDKHERCPVWKQEGECYRNRAYMDEFCPVSCQNAAKATGEECFDFHDRCSVWASLGECEENPTDMEKYCPKSCKLCEDTGEQRKKGRGRYLDTDDIDEEEDEDCEDLHHLCKFWAQKGECKANRAWMELNCPVSCKSCYRVQALVGSRSLSEAQKNVLLETASFGVTQTAEGDQQDDIVKLVQDSIDYMKSSQIENLPQSVRNNCKNRHALCSFWSLLGECEANKAYMQTNCAPACRSCHMIDYDTRCPKIPDAKPALLPGDLNKMFERIVRTAPGNNTLSDDERRELVASGTPEYSVVVLSRPSDSPATEVSAVLDKSLPPWVIMFENFVTPEECEAMIELGYKSGYKRSEDVGARKFDGTYGSVKSEGRTSENAWCSDTDGCRDDEIPKRLHDRIFRVTGIPPENSEDFQMLRYEIGQFYETHHDYIPNQRDRQCGPRILTFFLYLSDVEEGGGTDFPQLEITVMPKRGRAVLWPSVLDSDPFRKDGRTLHQALPVTAGTKFAANGWIHQFSYIDAQDRGCT